METPGWGACYGNGIWILATYDMPMIFLNIVGHDIVCTTYDVVGLTS